MSYHGESMRILHVDDDPDFAELAATFVEREDERFDVEIASTPEEGFRRLQTELFDCVVSDYDMPTQSGIEFLRTVREEYSDLPFILYTGKGSEAVASDAISAGVTDYLQKGGGASQYTVLANRIRNAVSNYRAQTALAEREKRLNLFFEQSPLGVVEWDERFDFVRMNETAEEILGYAQEELVGHSWHKIVPESDREPVGDVVSGLLEDAGGYRSVNENVRKDGGRIICEWHNRVVTDENGAVVAIFSQFQDITDRQRQERELERSREFFKEAERLGDLGAWEFDTDGELVWTEGTRRIHDVADDYDPTIEAAIEFYHPADQSAVRKAVTEAQEDGQPFNLQARLITADDTQRWVHVRGEPIEATGTVRGYIQDITDRKEREQQLERQNDLFRKAQEIADVGAWEYDIQAEQTVWTDQVYEIHDRPQDQTPDNEDIIQLYHPDDRPLLREAFQEAIQAGEVYDLELRLQLGSGDTRWVRTRGQPQAEDGERVRIRGAIQDITESKQRIKEARKLKRQYRALSENIPDGAVFLFNEDLQYERARGTELAAVGLSPDEIEGATPHDVFPAELADELARYFTEALNGNTHTFTQSLGANTYRNRVAPVQNSDGEVTHGIALAQNVTEQVEREQKLEAQNDRLEEFAGVVSHDLRNPLQVADGRLELLREECDSPHVAGIEQALDRMDALISDLLTLARQGEPVGETEPVDLAVAIKESWQTVETDGATVNTSTDQLIQADPSRLSQLLENLLRNAVEHGDDGVTITLGELEDGFYFEDDGPGIPESEREDVFDAGYSTAENGTGFGLSIITEVADAHGWDINVTTGTNGGTRFEITGVEFVT